MSNGELTTLPCCRGCFVDLAIPICSPQVTGDNVRTAVSVARECGLVTQSATVFLPSFTSGSPTDPDSHIAWTSVDDDDIALDEYSLRPLVRQQNNFIDEQEEPLEYSLAVTGDVFRWMVDWAPLETFHRVSLLQRARA